MTTGPQTPTGERILIQGGVVITMDPVIGDLASGDVLIEGSRIVQIAPHLDAQNATVVDARDRIVIPGFCDPHIHCWEGQIARVIPNQIEHVDHPTRNYIRVVHQTFGARYRPEDVYIGSLATLYSAIDGGITTVCDNFHNALTPEHSDASVSALRESGVRGVLAYGRSRHGSWDLFQDAYRLRSEYFSSDDQLTSFRLFMRGRDSRQELDAALRTRRDLDLWVTFDSGLEVHPIVDLYRSGRLDGRESYNHGTGLDVEARRAMAGQGGSVNVCPRIESQFRIGYVPYSDWIEVGLRPAISNDDPATYSIDMFREMQLLYALERAAEHRADLQGRSVDRPRITLRQILEAATLRGAASCGLADQVGSLTPGKKADIVLLRSDTFSTHPVQNAWATVVQGAGIGSVDTVLIDGQIKKWQGRLLVDDVSLRERVEASRDYLFEATDWPLDRVDFSD